MIYTQSSTKKKLYWLGNQTRIIQRNW